MNPDAPFVADLAAPLTIDLAGGKAMNLSVMILAGLPVPGGFVVTTLGFRAAAGQADQMPEELRHDIREAYRAMGSPPVAVRSSATAEDMAGASMAGQYETFLDVRGQAALLDAVGRCWGSLDSPRTRSYLAEHGIDLSKVAMAVVVQRLVPADVAGVLFTVNPQTGSREQIVAEASWGLGEAVVSGLVQPDVLTISRDSGDVLSAVIADKQMWVPPEGGKAAPVEADRRELPCLSEDHVKALWRLALKVEDHFGRPQDIEWAIHDGKAYLLQARPVTAIGLAEAAEQALQYTKAGLRRLAEDARGPWVLHNIAETLSRPMPLTWSVVGRFMTGAGGFGEMYRMAGFEPSPRVCEEGFLQLLAGQPYMDCALAPEMFFERYPFKYDLALLRATPDAAQQPPTLPAAGPVALIRGMRKIGRTTRRLRDLSADLDRRLNEEVFPEFADWCRQQRRRDLQALSDTELMALWDGRERRVMDVFAAESLLPSLIDGMAVEALKTKLAELFWDEDADELAGILSATPEPDLTVRANIELYEVAAGERTVEQWLADHGHRAPEEFDLATPRWRERVGEVRHMASRLAGGADPREIHHRRWREAEERREALSASLDTRSRRELAECIDLARRYMPFREDAKDYLMLGYALLRDVALEAGRRLGVGEDVFLLKLPELRSALDGHAVPQQAIERRRARREAQRRLVLPRVIDTGSIDALGAPPEAPAGARLSAFAVSPGSARGAARIVLSPEAAGDLGSGYMLVCPSTDPSWTPLFINAAGVVLERGGTLSHGAVVAREMGVPAVVLPGATGLLVEGEEIMVDGHAGALIRVAQADEAAEEAGPDPHDVRVPAALRPPPPGRFERLTGRVRNIFLLVGIAFLAAIFLLPPNWLYTPILEALDVVYWPLVRAVGKVGSVAVVAAVLAVLTMIGQRLLTDNRRLRVAKTRANELRRRAARAPRGSPRRQALARAGAPVQMRIVGAAFVPLAVLLVPLVMTFAWLPARVDPAAWNAPPGTGVTVVAQVDSSFAEPVTLRVAEPLAVDRFSRNPRAVPPVRQTLQQVLAALKAGKTDDLPAELQEHYAKDAAATVASLEALLASGVPPVGASWKIDVPEGAAGRFPVSLSAPGEQPLTIDIVLGDVCPPGPVEMLGNPGWPLMSLRVVYPPPEEKPVFWKPIEPVVLGWLPGWLWVYLLAYVPPMFLLRWLLGLA